MAKSESEIKDLYSQFKSSGMKASTGSSIEETIENLKQKRNELKEERIERIKSTETMTMPNTDEARLNIQVSMAERFKETHEHGTVTLSDFVEYLYLCQMLDIESSVVKKYL